MVRDRVVLPREEPVQEAQLRVVVVVESGQVDAGTARILGQKSVLAERELAPHEAAEPVLLGLTVPVQLALHPRRRLLVDRRRTTVEGDARGIPGGSVHDRDVSRPPIGGGARKQIGMVVDRVAQRVATEVVELELDPGGRGVIEDQRRNDDLVAIDVGEPRAQAR